MAYTTAAAIAAAAREVGTRETGTNRVKYNDWFGTIPGYPHGGRGYPWCASFQGWVADKAGGQANVDYPRTAGCEVAVGWFKARSRWSSTPHVGDWVFYGPRGGTHVELVVAVSGSHITTIGGNTSGSLSGRYYNGDGVYRKTVARSSSRIYGYGRPHYSGGTSAGKESDDMPSAEDVWEWDGIPSPRNGSTHKTNPTWKPASHLQETTERVIDLQSDMRAVLAAVSKLAGQPADVDEDAIVRGVLAGLTPERIAAAIPQDIAEQVLTALGARLTPKE